MTPPTSPTKQKSPSDLWTEPTGTATTGNGGVQTDTPLRVAVWLTIGIYAAVGVLIGAVLVGSLPFGLQCVAMGSYVVFGLLGWLPWQIGRD